MRVYRLAKAFGWTPSEIEAQPAVLLDWLLEIDNAANRAQNERTKG